MLSAVPPAPSSSSSSSLTVTTLNVNGLRAALRKGLADWAAQHQPDVLLLQEVRSDPLPDALADLGYSGAWFPAQRPGYSGVALLSRWPLSEVQLGMQHAAMDAEGRLVSAVVCGVRFASVYLPSGSSGEVRQAFKDRLLTDYQGWAAQQLASGPLVIGGDYNIAHQEIDLKNWRANMKNSGFLPHERAWMSAHLAAGLRDAHRDHLGTRAEYTWWSQRGQAYARDVGWRIDYLLSGHVSLTDVWVDRAARLSDHAPLTGRVWLP
ncbi:exodeoxyribonuclease III [Deinococcus lacus]|uniref:Exodeoxyribonuclease III n=1 Tax=Deinococcus lacus TaxID=392561 RepID=A0ABW1YCU7_9DEIO